MNASRLAALCLLAGLGFLAGAAPAPQAWAQASDAPAQGQPEVPAPMRPKQFPLGVTYEALTLSGRPFEGEPPAMILDPSLRMRGFAGCNNYSATAYPLRDQGLAVGPFALTRRECDSATMGKERSFLEALRAAQRWDTEGDRLTIQGPRGELVLERAL